jgi:hypothetical protein
LRASVGALRAVAIENWGERPGGAGPDDLV